ncbi:MAG: HDOD domain-containing protein [Proteobacteria bacterium]|nr:HDOD domain-containing protein [Pseudomonadota bacterium]
MLDPDHIVADVATLVSLPEVVIRINQLVDDPRSSAEDIGRAVAQDPALTARLLALANSAMFGMQRKVDTVGRAIAVLGTRQVRDLTLGLSAARAFNGIPNDLVSMGSFWHHSVLCAVAARALAGSCVRGRPESSFVAGLLHDVGQLVLFNKLPAEERRALLMTIDAPNEPDLHLCEQQILGFDHARVGGALARRWRLPASLVEAIEFHHAPARASEFPLDVAIVHLANSTAVLAEVESDEFEDAPPIEPVAYEITGLKPSRVLEVAAEARGAVDEVKALFQMPGLH